jgi:hypothetical protein
LQAYFPKEIFFSPVFIGIRKAIGCPQRRAKRFLADIEGETKRLVTQLPAHTDQMLRAASFAKKVRNLAWKEFASILKLIGPEGA